MVLIGPHDDGGWSQAHYEGLQYLAKTMPDSHVAYIELVPEGADSEQVFRSLSRKGFNFIIGTSFGYMDYMETVAKEFPAITYLHLTGYKSNGTNFGNFFGAVEDMKYLAGMLAGSRAKKDGNPKIGYMATFPIPEETAPRQRDHARRQADLPRVHDGRPVHQHLARSAEGARGGRLAVRAGADVVFTGRRHPGRRGRGRRPRASGRSPTTTRLLQERRLPDGAVLDLGSGIRPDRQAGPGQDLQGRLRVLRRRLEGDGPVRLHGWPDPAEGRRGPAGRGPRRRSRTRCPRCWPGPSAGSTSSPGRSRTARQGAPRGRAPSSQQSDLDQFPPGAPGNECKVCMYWWADGITVPTCRS